MQSTTVSESVVREPQSSASREQRDEGQPAILGGRPCVVEKPACYEHGPQEIGQEEIDAVVAALKSRNLFRHGPPAGASYTARLENDFAKRTEVKHALAVNSGTSALICGMIGLGVSSGDEVIVPAYTYVATAAAALAVRAIPVIAEIDESLTLDPADLERKITPRTRLIVPVHMRGTPCRMEAIMAIARKHDVPVLEDCAQANGATFGGRPVGSIGDAGAFSLQQFKIITAGEGSMLTTCRQSVFDRGACYHDAAYAFWVGKDWSMESFLGENYRMSELNSALGLAQLQKRDTILTRLRAIKRRMVTEITDIEGLKFQDVPDPEGDCGVSLVLFPDTPERAKKWAEAMRAEGMAAGSIFDSGIPDRHIYYHWDYIMNKRTPDVYGYPWRDPNRPCHVEYAKEMCPRSLHHLNRTVAIPLTQVMTDRHVESCIRAIRRVVRHV
jgi:8-amino-3,8-dideoxy-alpha-D-manno-octulosonate transaminase